MMMNNDKNVTFSFQYVLPVRRSIKDNKKKTVKIVFIELQGDIVCQSVHRGSLKK